VFAKRDLRALRIVAATSDLFLRSRIAELAKQTGADPYFGTEPTELRRLVAENRPELVILDLSSTEYDPFSVARELKMTFNSRLFGLFPHVRTELKKRADEIGFEYVVPNSNFLPSLRRVLLERAEDD
jgi:PleD family two-component response regulator